MHANEGRPFFVIITGKICIKEENDHVNREPEITIDDVFEKLTKGIATGNAKVIFEDDTGGVYEIPESLISVASKSYLLVGYGRYSIPVILVAQDLLYPTRRPEDVLSGIQWGVKLLEDLVKRALPEDHASKTRLVVVDTRVIDAPFSLDQIEFVPER